MNYNKSIYLIPGQNQDKILKKQFTIQSKVNLDKRRSDDLNFYNFLNKFKHIQKDKINKIPINHRFSVQNKNALISNLLLNINNNINNDQTPKKDKNYYLNLLNDLYINDSHLSNKNIVKKNMKDTSNVIKKLEKKKSLNYSKRKISKDNSTKKSGSKNSKKKVSYCSNDFKNKSDKKDSTDINGLKNKSIKKLSDASNEINEKANKYLSEKIVPKFISSKDISKIKNNNDSNNNNSNKNNKYKSSLNLLIQKKDIENISSSLKVVKNDITDISPNEKKLNKNDKDKDNKKKKNDIKNNNIVKGDLELEKCNCNTINNRNIYKNQKKNFQNYKCFLCCFNSENDLSDNES